MMIEIRKAGVSFFFSQLSSRALPQHLKVFLTHTQTDSHRTHNGYISYYLVPHYLFVTPRWMVIAQFLHSPPGLRCYDVINNKITRNHTRRCLPCDAFCQTRLSLSVDVCERRWRCVLIPRRTHFSRALDAIFVAKSQLNCFNRIHKLFTASAQRPKQNFGIPRSQSLLLIISCCNIKYDENTPRKFGTRQSVKLV
jgi:hypothetical protein